MNKIGLAGFGLVYLLNAGVVSADTADRRFYVAPMGSYTFPDLRRGTSSAGGGELAIGKRVFDSVDLEAIGFYTDYSVRKGEFAGEQPSSSQLYGGGLGANFYFVPLNDWLDKLYLHVDLMHGQGTDMPGLVRRYSTIIFDSGLGYNLPLHTTLGGFLPQGLSLRAEALYRHDGHNEPNLGNSPNSNRQSFDEVVINLGFRIPLGPGPMPPAPPAPEPTVEVVPVETVPAAEPPAPVPPCDLPAAGQPITLDGCKRGDMIVLRGVNFEFNEARLTVNAKTLLDQVGDALNARADIKVEVDGHTDGRGSVDYNQRLSERRAVAVREYLVSRGIAPNRLESKGFGKSMPIADNATDAGREVNRRVELKVTDATK